MNQIILLLLARRIALALLSLPAVSVVVFAITAVLPGDAAQEQLGQEATPEAPAALRALARRVGARQPWRVVGDAAAGDGIDWKPAAELVVAGGGDGSILRS